MRGERGQTAAEYAGALLVVATLIGAVATTNVGAAIRHGLSAKVCAIASGGNRCDDARPAPVHSDRRVLARAASRHHPKPVRSPGAKRVAAANRAAIRAIVRALLHPWGQPLEDADRAIANFNRLVGYCTDQDRRPPWVGCPGITSDDLSAANLFGLYDTVHAVHDELLRIWNAITAPPKPTQKQIDDAVANFILDAATADGVRDQDEFDDWFKTHRGDVNEGLREVSDGRTNPTGGELIARGARDPDLRNAIRQLYRPNAKIGDGGTADALLSEVKAGNSGYECPHYEKALTMRTYLGRILSKDTLTSDDRKVAGELYGALNKAIAKAGG